MAIGAGLAVVFVAAGFWLQVRISKLRPALAPALMVASLMIRLGLLGAVLILLGVYTGLNMLALVLALGVVFTALQIWVINIQVKQAKKATGPSEGSSGAKAASSGTDKVSGGA